MINAIVAVDSQLGIGKNNDLLVNIPGDLKYFREKTRGKCIVVGRKTLESFPGGKPLPGRDHIILTRDENFKCPEREGVTCHLCKSKEEVLKIIEEQYSDEEIFVCGGAAVYEEFFNECEKFYVTEIHESFGADRFFPAIDSLTKTWESEERQDNGHSYSFCIYERTGDNK